MKASHIHFGFLIGLLFLVSCNSKDEHVIHYKNGQWFNGKEFENRSFYSVNGIFFDNYNKESDSIIDLDQGYIIPPFGDAHTHNLADPSNVEVTEKKYLQNGIFYVQVMTNHASKSDSLREKFSKKETIDVKYANGGLTATLGHPHLAYETSALNLHWSAIFSQRDRIKQSRIVENDAYWFLDSEKDVEEKWDSILATKPDLIKIYLINTDRHDELVKAEQMGKFGLSEDVARSVVAKAHASGLKVFAHVENAYDYRVGLRIGVDGFGHLPGYSWDGKASADDYRLTDQDIAKTRERNLVIIPTANFAKVYATIYDQRGNSSLDSVRYNEVNHFLKNELNRLHKAGVILALGADQNGQTSMVEANYLLNELEVFDRLAVLKILAENTPATIYPDRKLGRLKEGYEASFLALKGNPLKNWSYVDSINLRVKEGSVLSLNQ